VRRLLLVRHAPTRATREFAFPLDEALDPRGRSAASSLTVPPRFEVLSSPALRCRETAAAAGLACSIDARLAECDFGDWGGRTLAEIPEADAGAWMADPDAAPHGGETLTEFAARVGAWLDEQATLDGGAVAITHGGVVKAAVVHALGAPITAFWRIDASPLAITELHAHDGRWTLTRANVPAAPPGGECAAARGEAGRSAGGESSGAVA
jgi:broad specificity phosphatase PhoE